MSIVKPVRHGTHYMESVGQHQIPNAWMSNLDKRVDWKMPLHRQLATWKHWAQHATTDTLAPMRHMIQFVKRWILTIQFRILELSTFIIRLYQFFVRRLAIVQCVNGISVKSLIYADPGNQSDRKKKTITVNWFVTVFGIKSAGNATGSESENGTETVAIDLYQGHQVSDRFDKLCAFVPSWFISHISLSNRSKDC